MDMMKALEGLGKPAPKKSGKKQPKMVDMGKTKVPMAIGKKKGK